MANLVIRKSLNYHSIWEWGEVDGQKKLIPHFVEGKQVRFYSKELAEKYIKSSEK